MLENEPFYKPGWNSGNPSVARNSAHLGTQTTAIPKTIVPNITNTTTKTTATATTGENFQSATAWVRSEALLKDKTKLRQLLVDLESYFRSISRTRTAPKIIAPTATMDDENMNDDNDGCDYEKEVLHDFEELRPAKCESLFVGIPVTGSVFVFPPYFCMHPNTTFQS